MDAITILKDDHRSVEQLFKRFEKAGERAFVEKRRLADSVIEQLSRHAAIEEQVFYPVVRATVSGTEDVVLESLEEHHIVKWVLSELESMEPSDERFDAKMTVLIENVRHHVEEEEQELFPQVRKELDRQALADLGDALQSAKAGAPTHPHPRSPDEPPGNLAAGVTAAMMDRIGDTVSGIAQGTVTAVQDLIARILGRRQKAAAPTGTSTTRRTAGKVRAGASSATDTVTAAADRAKDTASSARRGAERTVRAAAEGARETGRAARSGARKTATTAKRSTRQTATTAKRSARKTTSTAKKTSASRRPRKASTGSRSTQ